jgi:hypothetical protein
MSDDINVNSDDINANDEGAKEYTVQIKISDKNLQYKSDFNEAETVFWLEAVKDLVLKNAFEKADLQKK